MIYLGSPYTHHDPLVREERYLRTSKVVVDLLHKGLWVYSPIVHCHEMAKIWKMPTEFAFWKQYNFHMLHRASDFYILRLEGWELSIGLATERVEAERIQLPITFI